MMFTRAARNREAEIFSASSSVRDGVEGEGDCLAVVDDVSALNAFVFAGEGPVSGRLEAIDPTLVLDFADESGREAVAWSDDTESDGTGET